MAQIRSGDFETLQALDQLQAEIQAGNAFAGFTEAQRDFPPTFKVPSPASSPSRAVGRSCSSTVPAPVSAGSKPTLISPRLFHPSPAACLCAPAQVLPQEGFAYATKRLPAWTDRVLYYTPVSALRATPLAYFAADEV